MENIKIAADIGISVRPARKSISFLFSGSDRFEKFELFGMFFPDQQAKIFRLFMDGVGQKIDIMDSNSIINEETGSESEIYMQYIYENGARCFWIMRFNNN